jgi:N-methylhydantoinase A/acetophenone carboxylase
MSFSLDIDTGGTFTDGFLRGNGKTVTVKVDTTPHDFTLCFMQCIEEAAKRAGFTSAEQLLVETDTLRLSTTIGTNTLIQANGPKLGMLVTRGKGENAYAPPEEKNPAVGFLIPSDMIAGIDEETSPSGETVRAPRQDEVLAGVKELLEKGARRIVVSLAGAPLNPANEQRCREYILADYPSHYLGSVPLLLSTEVSSETDDRSRTNATLIDAYIHQEMAHYLYKADDDVRNRRYRWPLLIVHATGGASRVAKTKAIDTCDSGPAAGMLGAAYLAKLYGLSDILTLDVGGTSADIGLISGGEPRLTVEKEMGGIPVRERAIETISIGGGGSSIARVSGEDRNLAVGPESPRGIPRPACDGHGGRNPAVTDAWVALGYIDPGYFLGGRRKLDAALAEATLKRRIADPLGISVPEAAERIIDTMNGVTARALAAFLKEREAAHGVTMFAFGGAGGLTGADIAKKAGLSRVFFFPFGSQFCAFGSSCTDVVHIYSNAVSIPLGDENALGELARTVSTMKQDALFDMEGEGFGRNRVSFVIEAGIVTPSSSAPKYEKLEPLATDASGDMETLAGLSGEELFPGQAAWQGKITELRLKAVSALPNPAFARHPDSGESPDGGCGGHGAHGSTDGSRKRRSTRRKLRCGNIVRGFAFVESADTTILVPPEALYRVDEYLNGIMEVR